MDAQREKALARSIGTAIADRRKAIQMTQETLAELLDCGVEAVSRMERGATMPTLSRLIETAEVLGCPSYELLALSSDLPSDQAIQLAMQLEKVNPSDRQMLLGFIEVLTKRLSI